MDIAADLTLSASYRTVVKMDVKQQDQDQVRLRLRLPVHPQSQARPLALDLMGDVVWAMTMQFVTLGTLEALAALSIERLEVWSDYEVANPSI